MKLFEQYKGLKRENYILFFGKIVTNLGAMIWPMMTMILNKKLGLNATETAMFIIISGVIFLPANLWGGRIADKFNKKKVIICCDIISIVLFVISGFIPLSLFSMCVLLVGAFFQTLEGPAYQAMVADITPQDKREKAFSLLYMGGNIGLILSPTVAGLLFNNYLWLCFVISGLSISVSTIMIGFFVNDIGTSDVSEHDLDQDGSDGKNIWEIIRKSTTLILFVIALSFYQGAYSQFSYLMPLDISKAYPENGSIIYGTITSVNCIIVVLFTPVITMVMEKVVMTKKYALGTFLQALSFAAFLLSFGVIAGYYASIALFTVGEILTTIVIGAYLSERVPANFRGRIYGVTSFASAFMSGIVEWGSGRLFDDYGLHYAWAFSIGMTMVSVIAAVALIYTDRKEFSNLYTKADKT
nr:MFS transporter [uncultured Butyrivibrio sp.]